MHYQGKEIVEQKFTVVNIIEVLSGIVQRHTRHYQSDFEYDKVLLEEAVPKQKTGDKIFLWLCRESGTWCFCERNVFLKDTREYITACFYAEQKIDGIYAYIVELTGCVGGRIMGNIFVLDYWKLYMRIKRHALPCRVAVFYEKGICMQDIHERIRKGANVEMGKFLYAEYQPDTAEALEAVLCEEKNYLTGLKEGNLSKYLKGLGGVV